MKQEIIITDLAEIKGVAKEISLFTTRRKNILIRIPHLTEEENSQLEAKVTKHYSACGCGQGRISGVITLVGYVLLVLTGIISIYELGVLNTILLYFACSIVTMLIGKIYGLWNARKALLKLVNELQIK
ncbi:hypothetical protein JKA74_13585 [Marivirga sp. S37H4]|uniref:Uncharacterized protein n=1 Tax=Marivirga aurantiaca TaxID=2802615 RepID=A0A934X0A2_9BACT|nr:hypothetical protein [Marivirga aurantiaca]MBK6266070.1 hypothetical protein [Marivirga aurantiaca]